MPKINGSAEELNARVVLRDISPDQTGATSTSGPSGLRIELTPTVTSVAAPGTMLARPEAIYSVRDGTAELIPTDEVEVLKIRRACTDALQCLDQALEETDVVARETILTLFNDSAFRLGHFVRFDTNFARAVVLIHTAVIQSLPSVYTEKQVLALRRCLKLIRDNVRMTDGVIRECSSILFRDGDFDLMAPTADSELYDEDVEP